MSSAKPPLLLALVSLLAVPGLANAEERLRGEYIPIPDDMVVDTIPAGPNAAVLYLNRCAGGCTVSSGFDSSINDTSSIANGTRFLSEWAHGDEAWDQLVSCMRGVFEPFNVEITDVDPGSAPHHEVMVAGTDAEFGFEGALGVSPFSNCSPINNSLTFVFANLSSNVADLCWAAAQEPGHSWTLDHQLTCEDPMTYLTEPCGVDKYAFQNTAAGCHDQQLNPSSCACTGATQNSFQTIMGLFGANPDASGPAIELVRPADGARVRPGFPIEATATDVSKMGPVELYIDGTLIQGLDFGPFVYNAPAEMTSGTVTIEIRASDVHGFQTSESITVTIDPNADPDGGGGGEEGGGCSAGGGPGGAWWLALIGLALAIRRRRR